MSITATIFLKPTSNGIVICLLCKSRRSCWLKSKKHALGHFQWSHSIEYESFEKAAIIAQINQVFTVNTPAGSSAERVSSHLSKEGLE